MLQRAGGGVRAIEALYRRGLLARPVLSGREMLGGLLLAATVAVAQSNTASPVSTTKTLAAPDDPVSDSRYSLRGGLTFSGVYYPPYGGDDPYGDGARLDLAMEQGTSKTRFHGLLQGGWSPSLKTRYGDAVPFPGELALFAGLGFRHDTHPTGSRAFVLELDGILGVTGVSQGSGIGEIVAIYPLGLRLGFGMRFDTDWEVVFSSDLASGWAWQPSDPSIEGFAIRAGTAVLLGRSFGGGSSR
jgi:hypothetical protein